MKPANTHHKRRSLRTALLTLITLGGTLLAASPAAAQQLLVADGPVYFWRPGSADWQPAVIGTELFTNDALYGGDGATTEVLIGPNDFVRLGSRTQLRLTSVSSVMMQFHVASGVASFDLHTQPFGQTLAVDTPNAVFIFGSAGYYRVEVQGNQTRLLTRRGGTATLTLTSGGSRSIGMNQDVLVVGASRPALQYRALPELDPWDRWNDAQSAFYATSGLGVLWIDVGRREHRADWRPPMPRWERHDLPSPPGGWRHDDHRFVEPGGRRDFDRDRPREERPGGDRDHRGDERRFQTPVTIPAPNLVQPAPGRPRDFDRDSRPAPAPVVMPAPAVQQATPSYSRDFERNRGQQERERRSDERNQFQYRGDAPSPGGNAGQRPAESRPQPSAPFIAPPQRYQAPVMAPAPSAPPASQPFQQRSPAPAATPAPAPAPAAAPPMRRPPEGGEGDHNRQRHEHDDHH